MRETACEPVASSTMQVDGTREGQTERQTEKRRDGKHDNQERCAPNLSNAVDSSLLRGGRIEFQN